MLGARIKEDKLLLLGRILSLDAVVYPTHYGCPQRFVVERHGQTTANSPIGKREPNHLPGLKYECCSDAMLVTVAKPRRCSEMKVICVNLPRSSTNTKWSRAARTR